MSRHFKFFQFIQEVVPLIRDGHIHSKFCPHGTKDSFDSYIEKALSLGLKEISFTEHAPLPEGFTDPAPQSDSAMDRGDLEEYLSLIAALKRKYAGQITIHAGLEVDYIEGFEAETAQFLNQTGPMLDDAILSVHFLKDASGYDCLDYSPENFGRMAGKYGSVEAIYENYYRTLLKSIHADLGAYKPKRIGHMTLVHKFQLKYPVGRSFISELEAVLKAVKEQGYELDYNGAGTAKPLCRETYPPRDIAEKADALGIPLIYGSDAHQAKEMGQGFDKLILNRMKR
jgi:histidinol-phosphatase (PHP family)